MFAKFESPEVEELIQEPVVEESIEIPEEKVELKEEPKQSSKKPTEKKVLIRMSALQIQNGQKIEL